MQHGAKLLRVRYYDRNLNKWLRTKDTLMINTLLVERFRLFRHLEIGGIGRVNLFVGRNNAGKTALLEAIQVYASNASPSVLRDIVVARQETWSGVSPNPSGQRGNALRHLFFGHRLPPLGEEGIRIGPLDSKHLQLHVGTAAFRHEVRADGSYSRVRVDSDLFPDDVPATELFLVAEEGDRTTRLIGIEQDVERINRFRGDRTTADYRVPLQVVPTQNMPNRTVASLWDATSLTDLEDDVIMALRLIEPGITGVAFVEDNTRSARENRIPLVKIEGMREPLPLRSMGDGMTRLFHIVVALVNASSGILLIDEFENGLHWSVQPRLWEWVFQLSEMLDVQVFATTHSRDCIAGFEHAWLRNRASGGFFRLDAKAPGEIAVTPYDPETLSDALEMDVEVR
jgi:hypothetical protein